MAGAATPTTGTASPPDQEGPAATPRPGPSPRLEPHQDQPDDLHAPRNPHPCLAPRAPHLANGAPALRLPSPRPALRARHSALRTPHSALRARPAPRAPRPAPRARARAPRPAPRAPRPAPRAPRPALRTPHSAHRTPHPAPALRATAPAPRLRFPYLAPPALPRFVPRTRHASCALPRTPRTWWGAGGGPWQVATYRIPAHGRPGRGTSPTIQRSRYARVRCSAPGPTSTQAPSGAARERVTERTTPRSNGHGGLARFMRGASQRSTPVRPRTTSSVPAPPGTCSRRPARCHATPAPAHAGRLLRFGTRCSSAHGGRSVMRSPICPQPAAASRHHAPTTSPSPSSTCEPPGPPFATAKTNDHPPAEAAA